MIEIGTMIGYGLAAGIVVGLFVIFIVIPIIFLVNVLFDWGNKMKKFTIEKDGVDEIFDKENNFTLIIGERE